MHIEPLSASTASEWDAYVATAPGATLYHDRAWQVVAERAYRMRTRFLLARDVAGGPVRGVLPLTVVRTRIGRSYVTTGLFGAYGRILCDEPRHGRALTDAARDVTARERADYLVVKSLDEEPLLAGAARRDLCVIATLPLAPDEETMWRGFRDKIRNCIRKAQKSGLEVATGASELPGYYDVLAENMHRKGTPIYGYEVMRELVEALGARAEVIVLRRGGEVVSGALAVRFQQTMYVPFASSRPSAFRYNPNNLLYWEIIRQACRAGLHTLDFGRSPRDSSTLAFKLGWGAVVRPQPFYIHTARGQAPTFDTTTPAIRGLVRLWQRLPRAFADALGPSVCRRFLA